MASTAKTLDIQPAEVTKVSSAHLLCNVQSRHVVCIHTADEMYNSHGSFLCAVNWITTLSSAWQLPCESASFYLYYFHSVLLHVTQGFFHVWGVGREHPLKS